MPVLFARFMLGWIDDELCIEWQGSFSGVGQPVNNGMRFAKYKRY